MQVTTTVSHTARARSTADQAKALSQFYTKPKMAADCIRDVLTHLGDRPVDFWIEPSAGEGAFLHQLPRRSIGIDIDPKADDIAQSDFLIWQPPARSSDGLVVVIGNPPYGKNASGAVRFFNHAASFCDVIAFILPRKFEKTSVHRRLDKHFHLKTAVVLGDAVFVHQGADVRLPAVFQIWERQSQPRVDPVEPTEHPDFAFVRKGEDADVALQRVGATAGCVRTQFADRSASSNYFIRALTTERPVVDILRNLDFRDVKARCAGNPSIAKTELVRLYAEQANAWAAAAPPPVSTAIEPIPATPDGAVPGLDEELTGTSHDTDAPAVGSDGPATHADGPSGPATDPDDGKPDHTYPVDLSRVVISNGDLSRGNWVEGHLRSDPSYCFEAEVDPRGSRFGIDGSRISMLHLRFVGTRPGDTDEIWYERAWETDPPKRHRAAIAELCSAFPEPTEAQFRARKAEQVHRERLHRARAHVLAKHQWGSHR
jgi:predicted RNA methylase